MAAVARSAGLAAAMGIVLGLTADCASLDVLTSGQGDAGMEGASPDGAHEGGARDARALQDGGDATGVDAPSTCPIVYVSTTGSDSSTGCNPTKPKKTITAAVQYATSLGGGRAVHVCKGTYAETALTVNAALSLGGGYDCATWKRTSTFGYPKFDAVNETVIQNADDATSPVTLVVSGPVITSAQVVDGLTIEGSATGTVESAALVVSGAATPLVTNNKVEGGATSDPTLIGSLGLEVETGAAPDITGNSIAGGEGSTPDANTVWVVGSSGDIFQNNLFVGSGAVSTGFFLDDCQATTGALAVVENNAFLNLGYGPLTYVSGLTGGGNCTSNRHLTTISSFEAEVATHSGSSASGNVLLAGSCEDAGTGCIATIADTAATLFAAWSSADNGYSTLFGAGWMLKAGDPCAVTKSSLDLLATVSTDLYGTARTSTPSMGAAQFGGSCK